MVQLTWCLITRKQVQEYPLYCTYLQNLENYLQIIQKSCTLCYKTNITSYNMLVAIRYSSSKYFDLFHRSFRVLIRILYSLPIFFLFQKDYTWVYLCFLGLLFFFLNTWQLQKKKRERERETNSLIILPYETNNLARLWKPIKLLVKLFFYSQS